jgi:hypothetical protein
VAIVWRQCSPHAYVLHQYFLTSLQLIPDTLTLVTSLLVAVQLAAAVIVHRLLTHRCCVHLCSCAFTTQLVALCTLLSAHDVQLIDTALTALETVLLKEHTGGFDTFSRSSSTGSNSSSSSRGSWDASDRNPYALLIAEVGGLDQVRLTHD